MSEDVKLEVIKSTQDALSKYIKKPPLTEKLLRKPPFRYLHDITTAVMKETGYLKGLYSLDELNPENIKDREAKIAFLEKLIAVVNLSTGVNITARPNKIVAGLDVAKTNELLQAIGKALEKKVDSSEAVDLVLNKKSKGVSVSQKEVPKTKTTKETKTVDTKSREPRTSEALKKKNKEKTKPVEKTDSRKVKAKKDVSPTKATKPPSTEEQSLSSAKDKPKHQSTRDKEKQVPLETIHDESAKVQEVKPPPSTPTTSAEPLPTSENHRELSGQVKKESDVGREVKQEVVVKEGKQRVESGKETKMVADIRKREKDFDKEKDLNEEGAVLRNEQKTHQDIEKDSNLNADMTKEDGLKVDEETRRPQSARAVHRRKSIRKQSGEVDTDSPTRATSSRRDEVFTNDKSSEKPKDLLEEKPQMPVKSEKETKRPRTAARPASARPGAPRVRDRGVTLLADNENKLVSEPINLIVDTKDLPEDDDDTLVTVEAPAPEAIMDQVMDDGQLLTGDQGHLVSQILETQKELEDTSIASESLQKVDISWAGSKRQQETVAKEVERLRTAIQALTRAANPLGKLIDFLQEDIEAMQSELEMWTNTNQQLAKELQTEERLTEKSIEPLTRQLEDIDQLVEEQLEEISLVKAAIIRNDERIVKLLKSNVPNIPG